MTSARLGGFGATLDGALDGLRLDGAIFFRSEFTECWAYESPSPAEMAQTLHPGADRLVMFHIVAAGRCWIEAEGTTGRHWAEAGDVVVLPYGHQHRVGGIAPSPCVPIVTLFDPPPWDAMPVLRHGSGGARTDIVCGYLHADDPLFDPRLAALPPVLVVRPPTGPAARWVEASVEFALAGGTATQASTRLPELLVIEVLRLHLASAPAADRGWIAALRDPVLAPALASLHAAIDRRWTVADLARSAAVSRSLLDQRFRDVLGRSPIRYLTDWRMHVAQDLLASTDGSLASIARRVGYDSEEAFSRAFKRHLGSPPAQWRTTHRRD